MSDQVPTSVLLRARTAIEAQVVLALLRGEGLTAFVNGSALMDEFAVSQRLMGLQGVEISVRSEDLERAQRLLAEARSTGQQLGDPLEPVPAAEPEPPIAMPRRSLAPRLALAGWATAIVFFFLWLNAGHAVGAEGSARSMAHFDAVKLPDGWRYVWKDTKRPESDYRDGDHNHYAEMCTRYTREGWKHFISYDANENARSERTEDYARDGRRTAEFIDADEDGVFELRKSYYADGSTGVWHDDDQDGIADRYEFHAPDGRLVLEGQDEEGLGLMRTLTAHYPDGSSCIMDDLDHDGLFDHRRVYDETGLLIRTQVDRGLQGFVDEK